MFLRENIFVLAISGPAGLERRLAHASRIQTYRCEQLRLGHPRRVILRPAFGRRTLWLLLGLLSFMLQQTLRVPFVFTRQ